MRFTRDRRGQSVVVGTVILFGFLILALASYQAFAVPAQNNQAEFDTAKTFSRTWKIYGRRCLTFAMRDRTRINGRFA